MTDINIEESKSLNLAHLLLMEQVGNTISIQQLNHALDKDGKEKLEQVLDKGLQTNLLIPTMILFNIEIEPSLIGKITDHFYRNILGVEYPMDGVFEDMINENVKEYILWLNKDKGEFKSEYVHKIKQG